MKKIYKICILCVCMVGALSCNVCFAVNESEVIETVKILGIMNGDENGNMNLTSNVTRAEFVKMVVCASKYKDSIPEQSYYSPFNDVTYKHWSAKYVQIAVEAGWISGYGDGTFRPDNNITLEECVSIVLKLLGYTASDYVGVYPYAQLTIYRAIDLDENVLTLQGQNMLRKDCINLIYNMLISKNKNGQIYLTNLGYTVNNGTVNLNDLINSNLKGPYVVSTSIYDLGININGVTVEKNGNGSSISNINKYDVIYYSEVLKKIWVYSNSVSGTYQSVIPSVNSPTSVKIAGVTYNIESSQASYQLSINGKYKLGDKITALLGREGIVSVISVDDYVINKIGVITNIANITYQDELGNDYTVNTITIFALDGNEYKVETDKNYYDKGDLVKISYTSSKSNINILSKKAISGKVTDKKIGDYKIADDINIIDYNGSNCKELFLSRIIGMTFNNNSVIYYELNSNNEITSILLNNATGDLNTYGILTNLTESNGNTLKGSYTYYSNEKSNIITTNNILYNVKKGPIMIIYDDGAIDTIKNLTELKNINEITPLSLSNAAITMSLSDDIQIYLEADDEYTKLTINDLVNNFENYLLKAYYDDILVNGGRIRIIIAYEKN